METNKLTKIAILVALAVVFEVLFSFLPSMPQGGRISLSMLPIFFVAFKYGIKEGMIAGLIYGVINFMLDGFVFHWGSIIFDYLLGFTVLGLAGLFGTDKSEVSFSTESIISNKSMVLGMLVGGFARYLMHSLSGMLFFGQYAGPEGAFVYSFILYNLPYMAGSIALCIVIGLLIKNRVFRFL